MVAEVVDPGNPYEEGAAGQPRTRLALRPAAQEAGRPSVDAANEAGRAAAIRINSLLATAGISRDVACAYWHVPVMLDSRPVVGRMQVAIRGGFRPIRPNEKPEAVAAEIVKVAAPLQEAADRQAALRAAEDAVRAAGDAAGHPAGKMYHWRGGWRGHDESFGGLAGGDYDSGEEWRWAAWAERAIARIIAGEDAATVCSEEIASARAEDARRAEIGAEIVAARTDGMIELWAWAAQARSAIGIPRRRGDEILAQVRGRGDWDHRKPETWPEVMANWPRIKARLERRLAAKTRLARIHKRANLRTLRLTRAEIDQALASPEREAELREIAGVRSGWRGLPPGKRGERRLRHPAARDVLYRIWAAHDRAIALRSERARSVLHAASATTQISPAHVEPEATPAAPAVAANTTTTFGVGLADAFGKIGL